MVYKLFTIKNAMYFCLGQGLNQQITFVFSPLGTMMHMLGVISLISHLVPSPFAVSSSSWILAMSQFPNIRWRRLNGFCARW